MAGRGFGTLLTVVIYALIAVAVLLAIRQFVIFSGDIAARSWALAYNALTKPLVIPFGATPIKTPYGGRFDVNNALTIVVAILVEWALSAVRDRA
jgi:hypothetical protein